jgi:hypothetical protein
MSLGNELDKLLHQVRIFRNYLDGIWFGGLPKKTRMGRVITSQQPSKRNIDHIISHMHSILNLPTKKFTLFDIT